MSDNSYDIRQFGILTWLFFFDTDSEVHHVI